MNRAHSHGWLFLAAMTILLAGCGDAALDSRMPVSEVSCGDYLDESDEERGRLVRSLGVEFGWADAVNPDLGTTAVDTACIEASDMALGDVVTALSASTTSTSAPGQVDETVPPTTSSLPATVTTTSTTQPMTTSTTAPTTTTTNPPPTTTTTVLVRTPTTAPLGAGYLWPSTPDLTEATILVDYLVHIWNTRDMDAIRAEFNREFIWQTGLSSDKFDQSGIDWWAAATQEGTWTRTDRVEVYPNPRESGIGGGIWHYTFHMVYTPNDGSEPIGYWWDIEFIGDREPVVVYRVRELAYDSEKAIYQGRTP